LSQFRKAFRGIDTAIKSGTSRALNRALTSAKTKLVRALREETGLNTEVISTRTMSLKSQTNRLGVSLNIATKFGVPLSKFSPTLKRVQAQYKDGSVRARTGVTAKIGKGARQLVPGAFALDNKRGLVIVGRKAAYDSSGRYVDSRVQGKLTALKSNVFSESAKRNQPDVKKHLSDTFDKIVAHEINFAIQKKFDSNK
jgi:hypothetical protein